MKEKKKLVCDIKFAKSLFVSLHLNEEYLDFHENPELIEFVHDENIKDPPICTIPVDEFKKNFYAPFKYRSNGLSLIEALYNKNLDSNLDLNLFYNTFDFDIEFNILDFVSSGVLRFSSDSSSWRSLTAYVSAIVDNDSFILSFQMKNIKIKSLFFSDISFTELPFNLLISNDKNYLYKDTLNFEKILKLLKDEEEIKTEISSTRLVYNYKGHNRYMAYSNICAGKHSLCTKGIKIPAHDLFANQMRHSDIIEPACPEIGSIYSGIRSFCENKKVIFTDKLIF